MRKKLNFIASAILILCVSITTFTACRKEDKNDITTQKESKVSSSESVTDIQNTDNSVTESPVGESTSETTKVYTYNDDKGYTVYSYVEATNAPETDAPATEKQTSVETTVDIKEYPTVPEINNGLTCVRTQYAARGQIVTVSVIMGTPNAEYTIEFYENETKLSDAKGLTTKKADSNGTVEWSFLIDGECEIGNRKLIIKEKGSDKYAQTFITVNG